MYARTNQPVRIGYQSQDVRVGARHRYFYILEVSCRGYDSRCNWRCGPYAVRDWRWT
jgi:hypothetical protein